MECKWGLMARSSAYFKRSQRSQRKNKLQASSWVVQRLAGLAAWLRGLDHIPFASPWRCVALHHCGIIAPSQLSYRVIFWRTPALRIQRLPTITRLRAGSPLGPGHRHCPLQDMRKQISEFVNHYDVSISCWLGDVRWCKHADSRLLARRPKDNLGSRKQVQSKAQPQEGSFH
jgi:hypothetical protein